MDVDHALSLSENSINIHRQQSIKNNIKIYSRHYSVNSCLAPLASVHGKHIITIEGLGNAKSPHLIQSQIANDHGSQCGYCTPGIAMSMYAFMVNTPHGDVDEAFDGNLCRCTGYRPILDAAKKVIN